MADGAYAIQCPIKAGRFNLHLYVGHTNVFYNENHPEDI